MKILVCGLGSIGERHVQNLLSLGFEDIIVYRKRQLPLRTLSHEFPVYTSLASALEQKPDVALICNPTRLHLETARECLLAGCHVFVEKPLSHSTEDLDELEELADKICRRVMVGYMMRFHPCLIKIHQWIQAGRIGDIVYMRSQWGEYLPDWHPWEDYRKGYAALKEMGGGPGLTLSHELDTLLWLAGDFTRAISMKNYGSDLEVDTEHGIDLLVKFQNGATGSVHMDYFQSPPARNLEVVGKKGRIEFGYYQSMSKLYLRRAEQPEEIFDMSETFDRNDLFVEELKYFFDQIEAGEPVVPGIKEGRRVIELLEKAEGGSDE